MKTQTHMLHTTAFRWREAEDGDDAVMVQYETQQNMLSPGRRSAMSRFRAANAYRRYVDGEIAILATVWRDNEQMRVADR